jgi:hypothetical protein
MDYATSCLNGKGIAAETRRRGGKKYKGLGLPRRRGDAALGQATSCCFATLVPDRRAFVLNVYLQYELLRVE